MRALIAAATLAALLLATDAAAASPEREAAKLAQARERWSSQHARDYTYRLRLSCFCLPTDPVKIRVRDGKPRGTPRRLRRLDTIEELFARIQEEIAKRTAGLDVRYGPRGVPLDFSADPIPMAIDDEYTVRVRQLRIKRRG